MRGIAYAALYVAEEFVRAASGTLDVAIAFLEGIKFAVRVGAAAASAIVRLTLGGLINIHIIEFDLKIGLITDGHFRGRIEVTFLQRHRVSLSFQLRLRSIREMALDLADAIFPGISGRRRRDVAERLRRNLPDYSRRHYMPDKYVRRPGFDEKAAERRQKFAWRIPKSYADASAPVLRSRRDVYDVQQDMMTTMKHAEELKEQLMAASNESAIPEATDDVEPEIVMLDASEEMSKIRK